MTTALDEETSESDQVAATGARVALMITAAAAMAHRRQPRPLPVQRRGLRPSGPSLK